MFLFFSRSTGIRDDLEFLLEEELSNIQLCALHMEMRNTEQLLGSIGLVAYRNDCLKMQTMYYEVMALNPSRETDLRCKRRQDSKRKLENTISMLVQCQVCKKRMLHTLNFICLFIYLLHKA